MSYLGFPASSGTSLTPLLQAAKGSGAGGGHPSLLALPQAHDGDDGGVGSGTAIVDNRDAVACILLRCIDPKVEHIDWVHIAATIYTCCNGIVLTPDEVSELYFALLARHEGRAELERDMQKAQKTHAALEETVVKVKMEEEAAAAMSSNSQGGAGGGGSGRFGVGTKSGDQKWIVGGASTSAGHHSSSSTAFNSAPNTHIRHSTCDEAKETMQLPREVLMDILTRCKTLPASEIFHEPVAPRTMMLYSNQTLGPYSDIIRSPMSLLVLQQKILNGEVQTIMEFKAQIWTIAANCVMFNAPEGGYPGVAREFAEGCMIVIDECMAAAVATNSGGSDELPSKRARV